MRRKGWSDLPPDLLREIVGRLHVAADFVSFHAVCKPWRSSPDLLSQKQLLPWLLVPTKSSSPLRLRCVFSKTSYRVLPPPHPRPRNWVCSADGSTVRYLTVKQLHPTMHDPITGAVNDLPCFPSYFHYHWEEENPRGIIYGDGTTFLYAFTPVRNGYAARLQAALLCPGQAEWTLVDRTFETNRGERDFCAAYHSGRILVTVESRTCHLITPDGWRDVLIRRPWMAEDSSCDLCSYILESHGELLWASVSFNWFYSCYDLPCFSVLVSVYAIEDAMVPEKARWVEKEDHCLTDQVFFLGSPNSFAVDASLLGGQGGCAYFVYQNSEIGFPRQFGLFRYNFIDHQTELIKRLPDEWNNEKCTWFVSQPTIAPVQDIIKRKREAEKLKKEQKTAPITSPSRVVHIEKHYEHRFRLFIHDLPPKVKNSQLQLFQARQSVQHRDNPPQEYMEVGAHRHHHSGDHTCPSGLCFRCS